MSIIPPPPDTKPILSQADRQGFLEERTRLASLAIQYQKQAESDIANLREEIDRNLAKIKEYETKEKQYFKTIIDLKETIKLNEIDVRAFQSRINAAQKVVDENQSKLNAVQKTINEDRARLELDDTQQVGILQGKNLLNLRNSALMAEIAQIEEFKKQCTPVVEVIELKLDTPPHQDIVQAERELTEVEDLTNEPSSPIQEGDKKRNKRLLIKVPESETMSDEDKLVNDRLHSILYPVQYSRVQGVYHWLKDSEKKHWKRIETFLLAALSTTYLTINVEHGHYESLGHFHYPNIHDCWCLGKLTDKMMGLNNEHHFIFFLVDIAREYLKDMDSFQAKVPSAITALDWIRTSGADQDSSSDIDDVDTEDSEEESTEMDQQEIVIDKKKNRWPLIMDNPKCETDQQRIINDLIVRILDGPIQQVKALHRYFTHVSHDEWMVLRSYAVKLLADIRVNLVCEKVKGKMICQTPSHYIHMCDARCWCKGDLKLPPKRTSRNVSILCAQLAKHLNKHYLPTIRKKKARVVVDE